MKRLILVRHAKSSWKDPTLADFDRPLNKRGKRDAPAMGARLAARGVEPDLILASPARRARRTARAIAEALDLSPGEIEYAGEIYEADVGTLLQLVRCLDDDADTVVMVGHNPGFTDLCNLLTGAAIANLPTCAVAEIAFDLPAWDQVGPEGGELAHYDYPKNLPE